MRQTVTRALRCASIVLAVAWLAGCATPYAPAGLTGGFREQRLAVNSWKISFNGNGYTSEDMVVKFWLNRCAELTVRNGYRYFALAPAPSRSALPNPVLAYDLAPAELERMQQPPGTMAPQGGMVSVRSSGGYVYVPSYGGSVRTWSKTGVILMYKEWAENRGGYALHAQTVLDMLHPFIESAGKTAGPSRQEVIQTAMKHADGGDTPLRAGRTAADMELPPVDPD